MTKTSPKIKKKTNISYFKHTGWAEKRLRGIFYSVINEVSLMAGDPKKNKQKKTTRSKDNNGGNNNKKENAQTHCGTKPLRPTCLLAAPH